MAGTASDICVGPAGFEPLEHAASEHAASEHAASEHAASEHAASEHAAQAVLPPDIELTPIVFFSLFWTPAILEPIVKATNIYAEQKRSASDRQKGIR